MCQPILRTFLSERRVPSVRDIRAVEQQQMDGGQMTLRESTQNKGKKMVRSKHTLFEKRSQQNQEDRGRGKGEGGGTEPPGTASRARHAGRAGTGPQARVARHHPMGTFLLK